MLRKKELENPLVSKSRLQWLPFVIVGTIILNLFLTWYNNISIRNLQKHQPYIYVQDLNGNVEKAKSVDPLYRSEAIVRSFVENWLVLAYSWNLSDPSLFINYDSVNYPLPLYASSFALFPGYQETYLKSINIKYKNQFPFANYISGKYQVQVRIFDNPIVTKIKEGTWQITIFAYRTHFERGSIIGEEKFNHKITVRAIKPSSKVLQVKKSDFLTQILFEMQNKGLQIIEIEQL